MNNNNQNFPKNNNKPYNDLYNESQQPNYPNSNFYNNDNYAPNEYNQPNDYLNEGPNYQEPQNGYNNNQSQEYQYPQQPQQQQAPYYPQQPQFPQYPPHIDSFPNQQPQQYPQYPQYQGNPYGQFQPQYDPRFQQYPPQQPQPQNVPQPYYPQQQPQQYPYQPQPNYPFPQQPHVDRFNNQLPYYPPHPQQYPGNIYEQNQPQYDPRFQQYPPQQPQQYPQDPYQNHPYLQQPQPHYYDQQPQAQKYPNQPQQRRPQPNRAYDSNSIRPMSHPAFFGANYYEKQYKDNYLNSPKKLQQNRDFNPNSQDSDRYNPFLEFPIPPQNIRTVNQNPRFERSNSMYSSIRPQPITKPIIPIVEIPEPKPQIVEEVAPKKPVVPVVEKTILKPQIVEEATIEKPVVTVEQKPIVPVVEKPVEQTKPAPIVEQKPVEKQPVVQPVVQPQPQPQKPVVQPQVQPQVQPEPQKSYNPFDEPTSNRFSVPRPQPYSQSNRPPVSAFSVSFPQVQPAMQPKVENSITSNIKLKHESSFNIDSTSASQANTNLYNKVTLKNKLDNMSESKREEFEKSMGVKFINSDQMPSRKNKGTLIGFSVVLGVGDRFYAGRWFLGILKFVLLIVTLALAALFAFQYQLVFLGDEAEFIQSVLLAIFASIWVIWFIADILLAFLGRQKDSKGRNIDI